MSVPLLLMRVSCRLEQVAVVLHPPGPYAVYQPILASVRRGPLQRAYVGGVVSAAYSPDETAALGLTSLGAVLCYRIPFERS